MAITIDDLTIAQRPRQVVGTHAASAQVLASTIVENDGKITKWDEYINGPLIDWGIDSSPMNLDLQRDGLTPPTMAVVSLSNRIACALRDNRDDPPTKIVPNGDGGIVFEWHLGAAYRAVEFDDEGNIDLSEFEDGKLVSHNRVKLDPH